MDLVTALAAAALFPWLCLGFVLWMGRIEEDLPGAVRRAERQPDPPPVLAIAIPEQRRSEEASAAVVEDPPAVGAGPRPVAPSTG